MTDLSRRQFLQHAAVTAAVLALPRSGFSYPLGLPPGIQLYSVSSSIEKDAPAALRQLADIGYKEVEPAGFGSLKTAVEFRKALDDTGLHCPSAHLAFDLRNLDKTFDDAKTLGCTYATASVPKGMLDSSPPPPTPGERTAAAAKSRPLSMAPMSEDEVKRLAEILNMVGARAKAAGLLYASHNHGYEFSIIGNETAYDYLLKHSDPSLVFFEIDCGWTTIAGFKPTDFLKRYPGRFRMVHMSDYLPLTPHWEEQSGVPPGAELGHGFVPYKEILPSLKNHGIQHIFVEQAGPFPRMTQMEAAKVDFDYLASVKQ